MGRECRAHLGDRSTCGQRAGLTMSSGSRFLNRLQLAGLERAGNACLPGHGSYPSFRELGCVSGVDRVLLHVAKPDLASLRLLLTVLAFCPAPVHRGLMTVAGASFHRRVPFALKGSSRALKQLLADCVPGTVALPEATPEEAPRIAAEPVQP